MSQLHILQDATGNIIKDGNVGMDYSIMSTVPADGTVGYGRGAIVKDRDGAAGSQVYINEGTVTSCDFNAITTRESQMSRRIVPVTSSTLTVTVAAHEGRIIELDLAAGIAVTLPSLAASLGARFEFWVKTTFTGAATIKSVASGDIMVGHALMGNDSDNAVVLWQSVAASTNDTIDLFGTANSTGGIQGQRIIIIGGTGRWYVEMTGDAAGTEATPFANTV